MNQEVQTNLIVRTSHIMSIPTKTQEVARQIVPRESKNDHFRVLLLAQTTDAQRRRAKQFANVRRQKVKDLITFYCSLNAYVDENILSAKNLKNLPEDHCPTSMQTNCTSKYET